MKTIIVTVLLFSISSISSEELSLQNIEKIILSENLNIKSDEETYSANQQKASSMLAFSRPQISVSSSWIRSNESLNPMGNNKENYSAEIKATQLLYAFNLKDAVRKQNYNFLSTSYLQKNISKNSILLNAKIQYEQLQFFRAKIKLEEKQRRQREAEQKDIEALFNAGVVTMRDVRMQKIKLNEVINRLTQSKANLEKQLLSISLLLNIPKENLVVSKNAEKIKFKDSNKNSGVKLYESMLSLEKSNESIIRKSRLPQIHAYGSYTYSGYEIEDMDDTVQYGITLQWNIDNGNETTERISESNHKQMAIIYQLQNKKNEVETQKKQYEMDLKTVNAQIELQTKTLKHTQENYKDARSEYKTGRITLTQLNETALFKDTTEFSLINYETIKRKIIHSYNFLCE